jgi:hypothetical protein
MDDIKQVALGDIVPTGNRQQLNPDIRYRERLRRGEATEPIIVRRKYHWKHSMAGFYLILDGNHRYQAHKLEKRSSMSVVQR